MNGEQTKWAAFILLDLSLAILMFRSAVRKDLGEVLLCICAVSAGVLLKVQIG